MHLHMKINIYMCVVFYIIVTVTYKSNLTSAHIALTFPPARKYSLDFFDSAGSIPPCGMPKGDIKTSLVAGSRVNVTWHLGYPHRGGHRVELLDSMGKLLYNLTNSQWEDGDPTAQQQEILLPRDFTCHDCIIRLLRQSGELQNPRYAFWSCGDVDIVPGEGQGHAYTETCSGHGTPNLVVVAGRPCTCDNRFWGHRCQYEDECTTDIDCGGTGHGKCFDLGGTNLPRRQCFCNSGFVGEKCTRRNAVGSAVPIPGPEILSDEFLKRHYNSAKLDSRLGLFWRVLPEDQLEIILIGKNVTSYIGLGWRPISFTQSCKRFPNTPYNPTAFTVPAVSSATTTTNNTSQRPRRPGRRLHPMSCLDVVIGSAKDNRYRILDYWSIDIATPRIDSFWDGQDDILAARGWEINSTTVIIFRKSIRDNMADPLNDFGFDNGPMHVVWARGQEHGEYIHVLPSGVDPDQYSSVPYFYTQDELKYHGYADQRGIAVIDFVNPE